MHTHTTGDDASKVMWVLLPPYSGPDVWQRSQLDYSRLPALMISAGSHGQSAKREPDRLAARGA